MTQKELLYLEDAIEHESSIIQIFNNYLKDLENSELLSFMENQISQHTETKEKLTLLLKEKANE